MKLFKSMTETESDNWNKSAILGFYTYMLILFIDQTYNLLFSSNLLSSSVIFWTGLLVAFGFQFILKLGTKNINKWHL
ncbi:hypothetical protein CWR45_19510 [Oceanobacillus chungangensis]|uniref:Uncharacterized protein n=1 Tax=Oceanobacillus chungangensis TaxID=1229152 RepID=A0A3D8PFV8_9BACI|nr:hypothetical protein CWR45_19510 [Oceanobacillus chungangensis]